MIILLCVKCLREGIAGSEIVGIYDGNSLCATHLSAEFAMEDSMNTYPPTYIETDVIRELIKNDGRQE